MDPKEIVRRDPAYTVWISDDWGTIEDAKKPGLREVRAIDVVYADGSKATMVLDGGSQPIAPIRDLAPDKTQQTKWQQQQNTAGRETAAAERKVTRTYTGVDPQTNKPATITEYESGPPKYEEIKPGATTRQAVREYTGVDPQTNKPALITEHSDGSKTYSEIKPGQTTRKPVRETTGVDPQTNKPATVTEYDDGSKTYVEIKPGAAGQAKPIREFTGVDPQTNRAAMVTEYSDGTKTYAEIKVGEKPKYTRTEYDKETGKWHGLTPDGKWEEMQGGPGSKPSATGPGSSGPALPVMVVGQSQAALRQYRDQLQAEVASGRQTQAWADNRWNEAKEVATFSIQEAQLMQQERQSSLNANINLATTKLGHETGGIKTALEFALAINGKLPPGSPLGGQAFAALLGMNMIAAQRSGIYDIKPPTSDQRSLEGRQIESAAGTGRATTNNEITRLTNPGDAKAVETERAAVQAQLQQETAPPPEAPPAAPAAALPPPIFAPQPVTAPVVGAPPVPAAPAAPAPAAPVAPAPAPPAAPQPTVTAPPGAGASPLPLPPTGTLPGAAPVPAAPGTWNAPPGEPGHQPGMPSGLMQPPQEEFAALNQFQQQTPPTAPQMMAPGGELPPAVMRAKIAATPFWRLSESEYQWAVENGLEEEAKALPGMVA